MTTRHGGVSASPFDTFNLGDHVGDDPFAVVANRKILQTQLGVRPVFLKQVHGIRCIQIDTNTPDGLEADACVTTDPSVACVMMVADCLPVLFWNESGTAVGAAHAGWRGFVGDGTVNILQATLLAMRRAVMGLRLPPKLVLVDGNRLPVLDILAEAIVKGDDKVPAISAASILAKVTRDRWCLEYHQQFPQYGFDQHKGYGTADHLAALRLHGPCPQHRRTFRPVTDLLR